MKRLEFKKNMIVALTIILVAGFTSQIAFAQRGAGKGMGQKNGEAGMCMNLPDLSEDQMSHMADLRTDFMKETLEIRNKMRVKRAELQMLSSGDNVNMKEVEAKIDEISDLRAQMMKKHAAHRQQVRALLNDDQKVVFDQRGPGFGMGMDRGKNCCKGKGHGRGMKGNGPGPNCPWQDDNE